MSKPYDATTKRLLELHPEDWVRFLGLPPGPTTLLDADLATISIAADRLIRVDAEAGPYILHNEFESSRYSAVIPFRLVQYSVNAEAKHHLPVVSTVFLLHKGADSPQVTGRLERRRPDGQIYHTFEYRAIRVWQLDPEEFLSGGLSMLPFAPIAAVGQSALPALIHRMEERIEREAASDSEAGDLWTAAYVLLGLRYNDAFNAHLLQGVRKMKESVTYQAILKEGRVAGRAEGERNALLRVGAKRFGAPSADVVARLAAIESLDRLEALLDRVGDVETWDDLLQP
jgi:predicted transposase YdaD